MRQKLFDHVKKKYKAKPEYLLKRYPDYVIFRHSDNNKWFRLVMDVPRCKLGLDGDEHVDILNVKLSGEEGHVGMRRTVTLHEI